MDPLNQTHRHKIPTSPYSSYRDIFELTTRFYDAEVNVLADTYMKIRALRQNVATIRVLGNLVLVMANISNILHHRKFFFRFVPGNALEFNFQTKHAVRYKKLEIRGSPIISLDKPWRHCCFLFFRPRNLR